jgi:hypothetical protein
MIRRGLTLRSCEAGHVFVVLSDPGRTGGDLLLVNFTTFSSPRDDNEEIFNRDDYSGLSHNSVVLFSKARDAPAVRVASAIRSGHFTLVPDVPERTLERIIHAAKASRHLSPVRKALLN